MQKFYCYVDEAGQHTRGELFVVAVVFVDAEPERERIAVLLTEIEESSGKRRQKWNGSKHEKRLAYLQSVLALPEFAGKLFFSQYRATRAYIDSTIDTIVKAVDQFASEEYMATIIVDGLRREEERKVGTWLHKRSIRTTKIRGAEDESDPFIRLADALCGFTMDALEGVENYRRPFERAKNAGIIQEL